MAGYTPLDRSPYTGTRIPEILREQGRRQDWLARRMGYSATYVNKVLHGHYPISNEFVRRAVAALELPADVLFVLPAEPAQPSQDADAADDDEVEAA